MLCRLYPDTLGLKLTITSTATVELNCCIYKLWTEVYCSTNWWMEHQWCGHRRAIATFSHSDKVSSIALLISDDLQNHVSQNGARLQFIWRETGWDRGTGCVATLSVCRSMLPTNGNLAYILEQAVRLGGHHNMPPPRDLDFWLFDLEVGVGVACDLGYPCAKFRLPRPFGFRVRADVRDIRQTDGRQTPITA